MSDEIKEANQKLLNSALKAADKIRLEKIESSSKNVEQLRDWMINAPNWEGGDLDECLEIVENSRVRSEFGRWS